jgi:hypothetical protein
LGKEFLLFQVLRDDFLSLWVRGCWLVSFFFTPIYMLMLVFFAMFGIKKGSIIVYKSLWFFSFSDHIKSIFHFRRRLTYKPNMLTLHLYRLSFTAITSRSTSYILLTFWIFFFFFGESLLLITFNYTTISDTILSSSFFVLKQHTIFFVNSLSLNLGFNIVCFIFFLTSAAVMYLANSNYSSSYSYFWNSALYSIIPYIILLTIVFA